MTEFLLWLHPLSAMDIMMIYGGGVVVSAIVLFIWDERAEPAALFWPILLPIVIVVLSGIAVVKGPIWLFKNCKKHFAFPFHWIMIRYYKWKYHA